MCVMLPLQVIRFMLRLTLILTLRTIFAFQCFYFRHQEWQPADWCFRGSLSLINSVWAAFAVKNDP